MEGLVIGLGPGGVQIGRLEDLLPEPQKHAEHAKEHLEECRNGDLQGVPCMLANMEIADAGAADIGATKEELERFRAEGLVKPAEEYLQECRNGDFEHLGKLAKWWSAGLITVEDLALTDSIIRKFIEEDCLGRAKRALAECREGDFTNVDELWEMGKQDLLPYDELESSESEIVGLLRASRAKEIADECRNGDFDNLEALAQAIAEGYIDQDQVEKLEIDIETWERERNRQALVS
jgi:hypothetical protein